MNKNKMKEYKILNSKSYWKVEAQDLTIFIEEGQAFPETVEEIEKLISGGKEGVDYTYGDMTHEFIGDEIVYDKDKDIFLPHRAGCTPYAVIILDRDGDERSWVKVYPDLETAVYYAERGIVEREDWGYLEDWVPDDWYHEVFRRRNYVVIVTEANMVPQSQHLPQGAGCPPYYAPYYAVVVDWFKVEKPKPVNIYSDLSTADWYAKKELAENEDAKLLEDWSCINNGDLVTVLINEAKVLL